MARNDLKEKIYGRRGHKRASVSSEAGGDVFVTADKTNNEWLCVVCGGGGVEGAIDRPSRSSLSLATTLSLALSLLIALGTERPPTAQIVGFLPRQSGRLVGTTGSPVLSQNAATSRALSSIACSFTAIRTNRCSITPNAKYVCLPSC